MQKDIPMMHSLHKTLRQFIRAERGNVIVLVGVSIFMLVMGVGAAVDMSRAQTLQTRMSTSLDAAGLAAGATVNEIPATDACYAQFSATQNLTAAQLGVVQTCWVQKEAVKYFNANFASGYMSSATVNITAVLSNDGNDITLDASTHMPTTFLKMFGLTTIAEGAHSVIVLPTKNTGIEVVLALDNTYSMTSTLSTDASNTTKIAALKAAVSGTGGFLDTIYGKDANGNPNDTLTYQGNANNTPLIWVGMVPYTDMVNVGKSTNSTYWSGAANLPEYSTSVLPNNFFNATFPTDQNNESGGWSGCVDARALPTYSTVPTPPNFYGNDNCDSGYGSTNCSFANLSKDISLDLPSGSANLFVPLTTTWSNAMQTNDFTCPQPVVPMQSSKAVITTAVSNLYATGNTMINIGLAWGWRMMNSGGPWPVQGIAATNYDGKWPNTTTASGFGLSSVSAAYNTLVKNGAISDNKVLILMTDGINTDPGIQCGAPSGCSNGNYWWTGCCQSEYQSTDPGNESCQNYTCNQWSCNGQTYSSDPGSCACTIQPSCTTRDGVTTCPSSYQGSCGSWCSAYTCTSWEENWVCNGWQPQACTFFQAINPNAYMDLMLAGSNTVSQQVIDSVGDTNNWDGGPLTGFSYATPYYAPTSIDNEVRNVCDAIKAQGITIYTIGFGTNDGLPGGTGKDLSCTMTSGPQGSPCPTFVNGALLQYCASTTGASPNYYLATSAASLTNVFVQIGNQLNKLHVGQ